jgi:hypothetical protein
MRLRALLVLLFAMLVNVPHAAAQARASEAATVSQTVDGTVITIAYSRPQARGRDSLFGGVVHYDRPWTPGANWATTLDVSKDVHLNGTLVPKGTYSIWMIPARGDWQVVLDTQAQRFHTQRPPDSDSQIRLSVTPDTGAHSELLTWHFPAVRRDGATLQMRWAGIVVSLDVAVQPTGRGRLAGSSDAYVGTYQLRVDVASSDSRTVRADVFEKDSALYLRLTPNPFPDSDPVIELRSLPDSHRFQPAFRRNGEVFDLETGASIVFSVRNGRASGFVMLGADDRRRAKAEREQ